MQLEYLPISKIWDTAATVGDRGVASLAVRNDGRADLISVDQRYGPLSVNAKGELYIAPMGAAQTGSAQLLKAEDTAHVSGDAGVMLLGIRNDAAAIRTSADNDYSPFSVDDRGRLLCVLHAVNAGGASTQLPFFQEDLAHTTGDAGVMPLAVRQDTDGSLVSTSGDYSPLQVDADGNLKVYSKNPSIEKTDDQAAGTVGLLIGGKYQASPATRQDGDYTLFLTDANGRLISKIDTALPAGTNAIGKLAANSGVDIGDVDVLSLPDSIDGPGAPSIDSYASAQINASANAANQSLIAAPGASKQIWIYGIFGTADIAGSISFQDEDDLAISGVMPVAANGGFVIPPSGNFAMPWAKLATNKALEIDTVTCAFKGLISYAIVSV